MKRKNPVVVVLAVMLAAALIADADARQARRRDRQQPQVTDLDTSGLTPDALSKLYLGTWYDGTRRFWFSLDKVTGMQVQAATFHMAHFQNGRIDGNRLTLVSQSCVPAIGCYNYTINGTLLQDLRMDIRGTDDSGETVHFVLKRKSAS